MQSTSQTKTLALGRVTTEIDEIVAQKSGIKVALTQLSEEPVYGSS